MMDKPTQLPATQPSGEPLKSLAEVMLDRRATDHFTDEPIPEEYLSAMLSLAGQAPSGFNLQPWRFVVVRTPADRERLQGTAFGQQKIGEAPAVVIAVGMKDEWRRRALEVFKEGAKRGAGKPENAEKAMKGAMSFLDNLPMDVWVTRQTMIAYTALMLAAEAYGFDTAPMEGFDPAAVKREFAIPDEGEVVALLAIGKMAPPDKPHTGRLPLAEIAFDGKFGQPWSG